MTFSPRGSATTPRCVARVPPCPAWVSRSYSSPTRPRSGSWPLGEISTSQSIAHLLGLGQESVQRRVVARIQHLAELVQAFRQQTQTVEYAGAVLGEDGGPQPRVARGHPGRVAEPRGRELGQPGRE